MNQLVTTKTRLHSSQNCAQTAKNMRKAEHLKEVVPKIKQADGRGKQLISRVTFT